MKDESLQKCLKYRDGWYFGGHILKQLVNTEALSFLWDPRDPARLSAAITPLLPICWALMAQLWVHVKVT